MYSKRQKINKLISESGLEDEEILLADGFEDAFIGLSSSQPGRETCAVYSYEKCIDILIKRDNMSYEEAIEFFEYNTIGAWVGERTPIFVSIIKQK